MPEDQTAETGRLSLRLYRSFRRSKRSPPAGEGISDQPGLFIWALRALIGHNFLCSNGDSLPICQTASPSFWNSIETPPCSEPGAQHRGAPGAVAACPQCCENRRFKIVCVL